MKAGEVMKIPETPDRPYRVYNREGRLMESRPANLPLPPHMERSLLDAGYTIKVNGKKITKKSLESKGVNK